MAATRVSHFVKFFTQEAYADAFVAGSLHMNRLSYFKRIEAIDAEDGRPDANEAVTWWWQPDDMEITFNVPALGEIKITKADLAGPVSASFLFYDDLHLFCMCAIELDMPVEGQEIADIEARWRTQLQIDQRCLAFGPYAVVVQAPALIARFKHAFQRRGQWFKGSRVIYYDPAAFHGTFERDEAPFRKQKQFSYQSEYRVCVQTDTHGDDPLNIEIGDLSDICVKLASAHVNATLQEVQFDWQPKASVPE